MWTIEDSTEWSKVRELKWISIKHRGLNWMKVKLENWNEFQSSLKSVICIFANKKKKGINVHPHLPSHSTNILQIYKKRKKN